MVYGPCQGVHPDGGCELGDRRCVFLDAALPVHQGGEPRAEAPSAQAAELLAIADRRPLVLAELVAPAGVDGHRAVAGRLAGTVDAALLGDAPWARVQLPAVVRAGVLSVEGLRAVVGLTCRDRNRVALEGELLGLATAAVPMVLCLTGDHPAIGGRPDAEPVFDLDSTRLAALAAGRGMTVAVAESPSAPPAALRPARLASKAAAGATVCFVNHGPEADVESFVAAARELVPSMRFVVSVPVGATERGRARLAAFFPDADPAALDEPDHAVAHALVTAERMLALAGVIGVDLSAGAGDGEEEQVAEALATVARALGGGT
ncbi:MAG: Methylenetetrahydrofolate reductase [Amnibacterium sp.]|nr:Methylenetetrahydrofolate reductase [Amnibacterium sp.]